MRHAHVFTTLAPAALLTAQAGEPQNPAVSPAAPSTPAAVRAVDWVNTYISTGGGGSDYGGTMPFVTTPFGTTNWTAQTRQNRAASSTLEDAYDDFAVAEVAKAVGKDADYRFFIERSRSYRNLYNPASGFMQGRNADGSWADPDAGWTEGDKWVYTYSVLHDIPGLMALMGGPEKYNATFDEHFRDGHNHHDNEPSHHYGYLYDFSGQPWKAQARVRQIAHDYYSNEPNGIAGNEDCGQMSAWHTFTAIGFYPVNPVSGDYMIGSPLFTKVTLTPPGGRRFVIAAPQNSASNLYIQSARLNGKPLDIPVVTYQQIQAAGLLEFDMGANSFLVGLRLDRHPTAIAITHVLSGTAGRQFPGTI